ncbi:hypothetical protein [Ehrlichia canis]|uniref:hypothetical protein n=1 Tax=Ehrlichia canis TaxID=944 RepID=UPI00003A8406|nr:hypothetical protein [Ehrlichia canis]UKC53674.1 hypothetical protein s20019040002_000717 [Ehrlichia canis]UKC54612.1 hypothetical protein s20026770001_000718 [Ehrlichia canis]UKC55548.1 hypothetical protein s21009500007_000718 [Ehrlichia canis]
MQYSLLKDEDNKWRYLHTQVVSENSRLARQEKMLQKKCDDLLEDVKSKALSVKIFREEVVHVRARLVKIVELMYQEFSTRLTVLSRSLISTVTDGYPIIRRKMQRDHSLTPQAMQQGVGALCRAFVVNIDKELEKTKKACHIKCKELQIEVEEVLGSDGILKNF